MKYSLSPDLPRRVEPIASQQLLAGKGPLMVDDRRLNRVRVRELLFALLAFNNK